MLEKIASWLRKDLLALEGRERTFLAAGTAGILIFAAILTNTLINRSAELEKETRALKSELSYSKGVLSRSEDFLKAHKDMKVDHPAPGNPDETLARLANEIEILAREERLTLNHVRPVSVNEDGPSAYLKLQAELEGETAGVLRFLHKALSLPELLKIERFRMAQKSPSSLHIKAEFDFALFQGSQK